MNPITVDGVIFQLQKQGGISRIFQEIIPKICNMDESVLINLFTTGKLSQPLPSHPNINYHQFPNLYSIMKPQRIFHYLTEQIYDTLISRQYSFLNNSIWHSSYFTYVNNWPGPEIVTVYDMAYEFFPEIFNQQYDSLFRERKKRCIQTADMVISISQSTQRDVVSYFNLDDDKCVVIPPACSSTFKVIACKDSSDDFSHLEPYILYIGNRTHNKNFQTLVRAYSKWKYRHEAILVVAGAKPWTKDEIRLFKDLSIYTRIKLFHNPDDSILCILYNNALAYVYPSIFEGFGIPLLEAMNCGCPIVASRIPSSIEVAKEVPIYFDPLDDEELIDALSQAIEDGRDTERVKQGHVIAQKYSWDQTAQRTLKVYQSLA